MESRTKEGERRKTLRSLWNRTEDEKDVPVFHFLCFFFFWGSFLFCFFFFLFFSVIPGVDQADVSSLPRAGQTVSDRVVVGGRAIIESQLYLRAGNPVGTLGTNTDRLVSASPTAHSGANESTVDPSPTCTIWFRWASSAYDLRVRETRIRRSATGRLPKPRESTFVMLHDRNLDRIAKLGYSSRDAELWLRLFLYLFLGKFTIENRRVRAEHLCWTAQCWQIDSGVRKLYKFINNVLSRGFNNVGVTCDQSDCNHGIRK